MSGQDTVDGEVLAYPVIGADWWIVLVWDVSRKETNQDLTNKDQSTREL